MRVRGKYPYVVQLSHGGVNKEVRIEGLVPKYETGQVYHIEGECEDLEDELLKFPRSPHDDVADALSYGLKLCEKPFPVAHGELEPVEMLYAEIGL